MRKAGFIGKNITTTTASASGVFEKFEINSRKSASAWPTTPQVVGGTYTLSSDTGTGYFSNGVYPGTNFKITVSLEGIPSTYVNNNWYIYYQLRQTYYNDGKNSGGYTSSFYGTAGTGGDWTNNDYDISYGRTLLTSATTNTSPYFRALSMVGEWYNSAIYNNYFTNNTAKDVYIDVYLVNGSGGNINDNSTITLKTNMILYKKPCGISYSYSPTTVQEGGYLGITLAYAFSSTFVGYGGTLGTKDYRMAISSGTGSTADAALFSTPINLTVGGGGLLNYSALITSDGLTEGTETIYTYLTTYSPATTTFVNIGNSGVPYFNITDPPAAPSYLTSGNKAPILGAGAASWPPSGYTELFNSNADDSFVTVPLGFTFNMAGTGYTTTYMGSNTYITFSNGSTNYSSLSASNPAFPKFMFGAADNSYQRVAYKQSAGNWCKIRYEGNGTTSGTGGSPGITLEITLYNPSFLGTSNYVCEVLIGGHNRSGGVWGAYSATTQYATGSYAANSSYVFVSTDSTSTGFSIYSNYYVTTATS